MKRLRQLSGHRSDTNLIDSHSRNCPSEATPDKNSQGSLWSQKFASVIKTQRPITALIKPSSFKANQKNLKI